MNPQTQSNNNRPREEAWAYLRGGPVVVFRWVNAEGWPVEFVSENVFGMFGHTAEDFLTGKVPFADVIHPEELARVAGEVMNAVEKGLDHFEQAYHFMRADGEVRHLYDYTVVHRDQGGTVTHFEGYVLDDTERQAAEAALRHEEEDSRNLVRIAEVLAGDLNYQDLCGHALEAIRGYADLNKGSLFMQHEGDPLHLDRLATVAPSPGLAEREVVDMSATPWYMAALESDGPMVSVDVDEDPLCHGKDFDLADLRSLVVMRMQLTGRRIGYISFANRAQDAPIEDSSRLRRFLERLGVMLATAMDRVTNVIDRQAVENQLQHAHRMEAVGLLAGGVAHNFNNTLTVILGYTSMILSEEGLTKELREKIRAVYDAGESSAASVRQLLDFSRKQKTHEPKAVEVQVVLEGLERMLTPLLGEGIHLEIQREMDLGCAYLESGELEMILMNLAINAKDAMDGKGDIEIRVSLRPSEATPPESPRLVFEVQDDGVGMTEEVQRRLFEPFFTTKEEGHGTGLGLAAVYGVVQRAGGEIEIDSCQGEGAIVRFELPQVPQEIHAEAPTQEKPVRVCKGERVLLVEDQDPVRKLAEDALVEKGYKVLAARDGQEALEIALENPIPIDLLLSDVVMPRMDGLELSRRFSELRPQVPILLMSGFVDRVFPGAPQGDQGIPFLRKPFTAEQLLEAVDSAFEQA